VHEVAVLVPENLHFDVTCMPYQLLKVHLILAKGRFGLALALITASTSLASLSMGLIPRPPPPHDALIITG